ncbi:hypothetical protein WDV76_14255 [Xenorhabdus griffiniae]|uniref:hypothetical protein n=1 Tax=Xenorhabdus griffiniae TaxID=351672 RepID=UPI002359DAC5|nr:hypothetical protein [Xenorhabdus griffiniae]MDC9603936.1 hypothetical protein [Xenorhabdus griffiniae]
MKLIHFNPHRARLLPRLARTQKGGVFVQLRIGRETLPVLALCDAGMHKKIVQFCLILCNENPLLCGLNG